MKNFNYLRFAGFLSFAVALFQAIISFSPSWSLHFGAPEELVNNSILLIVSGFIVSFILALFGLYGLSGAGDIKHLPGLRIILIVIGIIYTFRGLFLVIQMLILLGLLSSDEVITSQLIASSIISLLIGFLYLKGTIKRWQKLKTV